MVKCIILLYNDTEWSGFMQIELKNEFITLGQLLKTCNFVSTGGEAKIFLQEETVLVNGEKENRRGRKLRPGDVIRIQSQIIEIR